MAGNNLLQPFARNMAYSNEDGGGGGVPSLSSALNMFVNGLKQYQLSKSLSDANDQIQQIRQSSMDDDEKRNQLNNVAQGLTLHMFQYGEPAEAVKAMQDAIQPPETEDHTFQNAADIFTSGTPEQQQSYLSGYKQMKQIDTDNKIREQAALPPDPPKEVDPFKQAIMRDHEYATMEKQLAPDENSRAVKSAQYQALLRGQNTLNLIGANTKLGDLNKLAPQVVAEAATSVATMIKNGVVTEGEIHNFMPETRGMTGARLKSYLTNAPEAANAGGFMQLYMKAAQREMALTGQSLTEGILTKAGNHIGLYKDDPQGFKETVANNLRTYTQKPVTPDDIIVHGRTVTTKEQQAMDNTFDYHADLVKKAKTALNSSDPNTVAGARQYLSKLGFDHPESANVSQINAALKARIRGGDIPLMGVSQDK